MKKLLLAMFVVLLMVGCGGNDLGEDIPESNQTSAEIPPAKTAEVAKIDLDDNETRNRIIAEAMDSNKLQRRSEGGETLYYAPNQETPYTGWVQIHEDGQIRMLGQFKDGKPDGFGASWYENGQKRSEVNYKGGKKYGLETDWHENGQKGGQANYKDGKWDGLVTEWYENGQKRSEANWKDDKLISFVTWKPNGENCPMTNVKDGNGVIFMYDDDGTKASHSTWKDGEEVEDYHANWVEKDLDDNKTLNEVLSEAMNFDEIPADYTGWVKAMGGNGQVMILAQYKDGKGDGFVAEWYKNGQKKRERTHKDGKLWTAVVWKPNGEKCPVTNVVNGNGVWVKYYPDGTEKERLNYKDGELVKD